MGLTTRCPQCHDHKYDPLTQREYYRFYAFFNNVPEQGLDGQKGNAVHFMKVPMPEQQTQLDTTTKKVAELDQELKAREVSSAPDRDKWELRAAAMLDKAPAAA